MNLEGKIQRVGNDVQELKRFSESNRKDIQQEIIDLKKKNDLNEKNIKRVEQELDREKLGQNKKIHNIMKQIEEMRMKIQKSEEYFMENRFVNTKAENLQCRTN